MKMIHFRQWLKLALPLAFATAIGGAEPFAKVGYIELSPTQGFQYPQGMWVLPDYKILMARIAYGYGLALNRWNAAGSIDPTFAPPHGELMVPHFNSFAGLQRLADGSWLVAGSVYLAGDDDFALAHLTSDGELDTHFGTGGVVTTDLNFGSSDNSCGMLVQPDGKILLAGTSTAAEKTTFAIVRYTVDGELDLDFGNAGMLFGEVPISRAMAFLPGGEILTAVSDGTDLVVKHLLADGTLDPAFAGAKAPRVHSDQVALFPSQLIRQPDGEFLVIGANAKPSPGKPAAGIAIARFHADGTVDTAFGKGGMILASPYTGDRTAVLDSHGNLAVVGVDLQYFRPTIALVSPDGSINRAFEKETEAALSFVSFANGMGGIAIQPDGKLVVQGATQDFATNGFRIFAARLLPTGQLDAEPGQIQFVTVH